MTTFAPQLNTTDMQYKTKIMSKMKQKRTWMKWSLALCMACIMPSTTTAQQLLTLDSCRTMALRNNKQMRVAEVKQDVAANLRHSARTMYLPHLSALGTYQHTSKAISLLSSEQKTTLPQLGTTVGGALQQSMSSTLTQLPQQTLMALQQMGLSPEAIGQLAGQSIGQVAGTLNAVGQSIVDAFDTDTRNAWAGSILLTQPLFMGGSIVAMNKMADLEEQMAANAAEVRRQATLYDIDRAYWQVVSLNHKKKLAESFLQLVKKLDDDVDKMIQEGVATKSDGLSVSVKVNEAEMACTKVNDGLVLSKMLLCQLCGLPVGEPITLADEESENIAAPAVTSKADVQMAWDNRPELKILQNTIDMGRQSTNLLKAGNLPQLALTGGYAVTNPNLFDGFHRKFGGFWHIGVTARIPLWNWGDVMYKVRAAKGATAIARLELDEAREMIELQVNQNAFRVDEANKKLAMARSNIERANENLRTANLGFSEGVITPTTVMEAQTAWLQAQSQKIDAEIDVRLSQVELQKSLGVDLR